MVKNNITDYELYVDYDNDRIIVRFPWKVEETEFNPEEAIKELSATARLTFREGNPIDSTTGLLKEDSEVVRSALTVPRLFPPETVRP